MALLDRDTHLYDIMRLSRELDLIEIQLIERGFPDLSLLLNKLQQDAGIQINLNDDTPRDYVAQGQEDAQLVANYQPVTFERLSSLVTELTSILNPDEYSTELNVMRTILADAPAPTANSPQPQKRLT